MTGGGKINKPRSARCRTNTRKRKRDQLKSKKAPHLRSEETLSSTTGDVLRQCRTNPKANIKLSGKKKRILLKETKRLIAKRKQMEVTTEIAGNSKVQSQEKQEDQEAIMDTS